MKNAIVEDDKIEAYIVLEQTVEESYRIDALN